MLRGVMLCEHAQRVLQYLKDTDWAGSLLDEATDILGANSSMWSAGLSALRGRIFAQTGAAEKAIQLLNQALDQYEAMGNTVEAEKLHPSYLVDHDAETESEDVAATRSLAGQQSLVRQMSLNFTGQSRLVNTNITPDGDAERRPIPLSSQQQALVKTWMPPNDDIKRSAFAKIFRTKWLRVSQQLGDLLLGNDLPQIQNMADQAHEIALELTNETALAWLPWEFALLPGFDLPFVAAQPKNLLYRAPRQYSRGLSGSSSDDHVLLIRLGEALESYNFRGKGASRQSLYDLYQSLGSPMTELSPPGFL